MLFENYLETVGKIVLFATDVALLSYETDNIYARCTVFQYVRCFHDKVLDESGRKTADSFQIKVLNK